AEGQIARQGRREMSLQDNGLEELICPTGRKSEFVSSPLAKNIPLCDLVESNEKADRPAPRRGTLRPIVTKRGAGCDGRGQCRLTSDVAADGEVVWSWRPDAGAKRVEHVFTRDGDNKARSHRGEHGISRKPPRREGRVCPVEPVVTLLVCFLPLARQAAGAAGAPAFPAPSPLRDDALARPRAARLRRGNAKSHPQRCLTSE